MNYRSRLIKEQAESKKQKEKNIVLTTTPENIFSTWTAFLFGPEDSPYKDGIFEVKITIPQNYPMVPPKMMFITRIFHPNVNYSTGEICLDVLKDQWTPMWTLESACLAILDLLTYPNPDSPLNCDAGKLVNDEAYY